MKKHIALFIIILVGLQSPLVSAKDLKFALVPKDELSPYFIQSKYGCEKEAAKIGGITCIYRGPNISDARAQDRIIEELIHEGVDGIAIAVVRSNNLVNGSMRTAMAAGIPIITFDADFDDKTIKVNPNIRLAYIGTNNFEMGKILGEQAKVLRPKGGKVVILTGRPDSPNLNLRVMGVRAALSGKTYSKPPGEQLDDDNGWTEVRELFISFGDYERGVQQMQSVMDGKHNADTFIAVAGFPQISPSYRAMIAPFKEVLAKKEIVLSIADTTESQLELLRDGLSHTNVGQQPYVMGQEAIRTLHKIVTGQAYDKTVFTALVVCTVENYSTCLSD